MHSNRLTPPTAMQTLNKQAHKIENAKIRVMLGLVRRGLLMIASAIEAYLKEVDNVDNK